MNSDENIESISPSARDVVGKFFGTLGGHAIVGTLLLFGFFIGFFVGGVGFHDPDTCWILALGQHIVETGSLPATDPYSYTYNFGRAEPKPFVMYQWLTEVIFYLFFKLGGGTALLMFVGVICTLAYLVVPLKMWGKTGAPPLKAAGVVILGIIACSARCLARPEIFSFLFMGLVLLLILDMRKEESMRWRYPLIAALIMIVWCNLHSGCAAGLILLGVLTVVRLGETVISIASHRSVNAPYLMLPLTTFVAATLGTLVNPKGIGLWHYIVFSLFASPINKRIVETHHITLSDLREYNYYPFFIIFAIFLVSGFTAVKRMLADPQRDNKNFRLLITSIISGVVCAYLGFATRRVVAFSTIALVAETAFILSPMITQRTVGGSWSKLFTSAESIVKPYIPLPTMHVVLVLALSLLGTYLCSPKIVKPDIPQAGMGCPVPQKSLEFLKTKMPDGNMLNDPQFGDMMLWSFNPKPKVFIDTRFDMYGFDFIHEFDTAAECLPGWQQVLEKYKVDWVFLPKKFELINVLKKDDGWKEIFSDEVSVIMVRKGN